VFWQCFCKGKLGDGRAEESEQSGAVGFSTYCAAAHLAALWHNSIVLLPPLQPCGTYHVLPPLCSPVAPSHALPPPLQPCGTTVPRCRPPCSPVAQLYCAAPPLQPCGTTVLRCRPPCSPVAHQYCAAAPSQPCGTAVLSLLPPPCSPVAPSQYSCCRPPRSPVAQQYCAAAPLAALRCRPRSPVARRTALPPPRSPVAEQYCAAAPLAALWHSSTVLPPPLQPCGTTVLRCRPPRSPVAQ
jgi:hypothetical protein